MKPRPLIIRVPKELKRDIVLLSKRMKLSQNKLMNEFVANKLRVPYKSKIKPNSARLGVYMGEDILSKLHKMFRDKGEVSNFIREAAKDGITEYKNKSARLDGFVDGVHKGVEIINDIVEDKK